MAGDQLRALQAVVDTGTFDAAAATLPTVCYDEKDRITDDFLAGLGPRPAKTPLRALAAGLSHGRRGGPGQGNDADALIESAPLVLTSTAHSPARDAAVLSALSKPLAA